MSDIEKRLTDLEQAHNELWDALAKNLPSVMPTTRMLIPQHSPKKPTPKIIDWASLAEHVPVQFHNAGNQVGFTGYLSRYTAESSHPFSVAPYYCFERASLETGLWVANHDGKNPWPLGTIIEYVFRNGDRGVKLASELIWNINEQVESGEIIMSRCIGLQDGWSYELSEVKGE